jgi:hypothetical protein
MIPMRDGNMAALGTVSMFLVMALAGVLTVAWIGFTLSARDVSWLVHK